MPLDRSIAVQVYIRDGWKCRHCNFRGNLHPHHVKYQSHDGTDDLNNLITLCAQCHHAHHDGHLTIIVLDILEKDVIIRFVRENWKPQ
jgi:hypothetical protein